MDKRQKNPVFDCFKCPIWMIIIIFLIMKSPALVCKLKACLIGLWFLSIIFSYFCYNCGAQPHKTSVGAEERKAFKNLEMFLLLSLEHSPWTKSLLLNLLSAVNKILLIHKLRILWINYICHEMTGCNVYISQHMLLEHKPASLYHSSCPFTHIHKILNKD